MSGGAVLRSNSSGCCCKSISTIFHPHICIERNFSILKFEPSLHFPSILIALPHGQSLPASHGFSSACYLLIDVQLIPISGPLAWCRAFMRNQVLIFLLEKSMGRVEKHGQSGKVEGGNVSAAHPQRTSSFCRNIDICKRILTHQHFSQFKWSSTDTQVVNIACFGKHVV